MSSRIVAAPEYYDVFLVLLHWPQPTELPAHIIMQIMKTPTGNAVTFYYTFPKEIRVTRKALLAKYPDLTWVHINNSQALAIVCVFKRSISYEAHEKCVDYSFALNHMQASSPYFGKYITHLFLTHVHPRVMEHRGIANRMSDPPF